MGIPWWPTSKETAPPFWPEEWLGIQWPDENQVNEMAIMHSTHGMQIPGPEGKKASSKTGPTSSSSGKSMASGTCAT